MNDLFIEILTPRPLNTPEDGREVLQLWLDLLPELAPERFGSWEPVRERFELDAAVAAWRNPFFTTRRKPRILGMVFMRRGPRLQHSTFSLSMATAAVNKAVGVPRLLAFLKAAAARLRADFAYLHLLTEPDIAEGAKADTVSPVDLRKPTYSLSVVTDHLKRFVPDLYWATVFGGPYVQHFGRDRLLSAPAYALDELSSGAICLQLSEHVLDMKSRFAEVDAARRRVKQHLNRNSFFDSALHPADRDFTGRSLGEVRAKEEAWYAAHRYDTPVFDFTV